MALCDLLTGPLSSGHLLPADLFLCDRSRPASGPADDFLAGPLRRCLLPAVQIPSQSFYPSNWVSYKWVSSQVQKPHALIPARAHCPSRAQGGSLCTQTPAGGHTESDDISTQAPLSAPCLQKPQFSFLSGLGLPEASCLCAVWTPAVQGPDAVSLLCGPLQTTLPGKWPGLGCGCSVGSGE